MHCNRDPRWHPNCAFFFFRHLSGGVGNGMLPEGFLEILFLSFQGLLLSFTAFNLQTVF